MSDKETPKDVIDSYRRRQENAKRAPIIIGVAALFVVVGAGFVIFWLLGSNKPSIPFLSTDTPTPTNTLTPTSTATITATPTTTPSPTASPTITMTPTQSGPFIYEVQEGDSLWSIAQQFEVDMLTLIKLNNLDPANPNIRVGDKLTIPGPDTQLPTDTPLPTNLPRGTKIEYQVQLGDSIGFIATKFNSTVDAIKEENDIENENEIFVGQILIVPVNLVTPIPTATNTLTPTP
jgi:LysM repeat protein